MPTEIKANELRDVDVSFVSLVKRGANRIPFRLTKEDGFMIDFNRIFRKSEDAADAKKAVIVKDAAAEAATSAAIPGTMPIPTTPEAAVAAATALLKQNGYNVMLAQAEQVASTPDAKSANAADSAAGADKGEKVAEKPVADKGAEKPAAEKKPVEKADETDPIELKKAQIAAAQAELVELEKGAAQKSKPQDVPVNQSPNKEDTSAKGVTMPGGKAAGGDCHEEISESPEIDKDGSEEKKKTFALMAKLEESLSALATLVKTSTEKTEARLAGVEASVKKSDATIVAKVLGGAPGDEQPAHVRKAASSAPPLLDTAISGHRFT